MLSSCPFAYKGSTNSAGYCHLKKVFLLENLFYFISFLICIISLGQDVQLGCIGFCSLLFYLLYTTFYLLDHWFSGDKLSLPPCGNTPHEYIVQKYANTYTGKRFCGHRGVGAGDMEDMLSNFS